MSLDGKQADSDSWFQPSKGRTALLLDGRYEGGPRYVAHDRHRFDVDQPKPEMANFFQQTFNDLIEAQQPQGLA